MSEEIVLKEVEITKLRLRPGDFLVIRLPSDTKHNWMQRLAMQLNKMLPRNRTLIVCNDEIKFELISQEEAEQMKKEGESDGREA